MQTIWKFQLLGKDPVITMPRGARILSIHEQYGNICLWALVDPEAKLEKRSFLVLATGEPYDNVPNRFIGTVTFNDATLVFHVFEHDII